jgi:hypothetical protein
MRIKRLMVRYAPDSGAKANIAGLPRWAQVRTSVARFYNSLGRLSRCDGMLGLRQRFRNFTRGLDK